MSRVTKIEQISITPILLQKTSIKRVAAYARVSTYNDEQLNSLEAQKDYYEKKIEENPSWVLAGIYVDEGITGTSYLHRAEFQRMIEDCKQGKVDMVLTKSVSRFARNTVDALNVIRELREIGVGVFFERENVWTLDSKGEFLITLLTSLAQEEARSISENTAWGLRKRLLNAIFLLPEMTQSHQNKISISAESFLQCAVNYGTLFSCITSSMKYDGSVTQKNSRRSSPAKVSSSCHTPPSGFPSDMTMLMIRLFTIFCKLNQITLSDRQWFEQDIRSLCQPDCSCSYCGAAGCMEFFACYNRYLVGLYGNQPVTHVVPIKRYRCTSCTHTHAALSSSMVPYRSYSLRFILTVLRSYFLHRMSVEEICATYGIAISTLYQWKRLFLKQKALWLGALEDLLQEEGSFMDSLEGRHLKEFYRVYRVSVMESFHGTSVELPSGGLGDLPTVT